MKQLLLFLTFLLFTEVYAQDDLMQLMQANTPAVKTPVYATFKSTRVINLQSNETVKAKHLDFRIMHRFQPMDIAKENVYGLYNLLGLDGAAIRIGLEYGISDKWTLGMGRTSTGKTYDLMTKVKLLEQTKGRGNTPVGITFFSNIGIVTNEWTDKNRKNLFSSRLSYVGQVIITKKFNEHVSLLFSPTLVHHNLVQTTKQPNDIYAIGIGGSFKLSRSTRFTLEYIPRLNGQSEPKNLSGTPLYHDAFAFGFDIETGGHVFQLHFSTAGGLIEQQFIAQNTGELALRSLRFGFNISRMFSFDTSTHP